MARTFLRQDTQVKNSDVYDDTLAAGPSLESGAADIEHDLNALRSQVKRLLWDDAAGNWHDDVATSDGKKRGVNELNADLATLESDVSNVDNTSDLNKPISTATQAALDLKRSIGAEITDAEHGDRAGGALHANATQSIAGFMSAVDKVRFDNTLSSVITFKQGAVSGAGVVGTWAEVHAFAVAAAGQWRLLIDNSITQCEVPATADTDFRGLGILEWSGTVGGTGLIVKDGAKLRNVGKIGFALNVLFEASTTPGLIMENTGSVLALLQGGTIEAIFGVTTVPPVQVTAASLIIASLEAGRIAHNSYGGPVIDFQVVGGFHILAITVNSNGSGVAFENNSLQADATTTMFHIFDATGKLGDQSTYFPGTFAYLPIDKSDSLQWSSGDTASRPTILTTGQPYFDTTLGYNIWWNGAAWVDATGAAV